MNNNKLFVYIGTVRLGGRVRRAAMHGCPYIGRYLSWSLWSIAIFSGPLYPAYDCNYREASSKFQSIEMGRGSL